MRSRYSRRVETIIDPHAPYPLWDVEVETSPDTWEQHKIMYHTYQEALTEATSMAYSTERRYRVVSVTPQSGEQNDAKSTEKVASDAEKFSENTPVGAYVNTDEQRTVTITEHEYVNLLEKAARYDDLNG